MKKLSFLFCLIYFATFIHAQDNILRADFRQRPPEMIIDGEKKLGPLKDILEIAAQKLGLIVKWRNTPFPRSLSDLKDGKIDIIPRTVKTQKRETFVNYLGPIGYQDKTIFFLVKKGYEHMIQSYDDLKSLKIAVKRKTAYFKRFNEDTTLHKEESMDDDNMVKMFDRGRFDTMAILDVASLEIALKKYKITNYSYAKYKYSQRNGNYYGMSKTSKHSELYEQLNAILKNMAKTGEVTKIYNLHGIKPPLQ
ncbi:MAG: transporter substrate-binding domain-containing protein [Campylobacteraceae bacterium]|nr:transporter substrate-binding domain-containing protein [Campylobacteraceae bacterium]